MPHRVEKINELLRQEVSQLLHGEIEFDDVWITVTGVNTSPDLSQAKIKVTVMPKEKTEEALSIIQKNVGSLQRKLNRRLSMRWVPYLIFELDKGEISAQNLEETLKDK